MTTSDIIQIIIAVLYGGTILVTLYISLREMRNANKIALQQSKEMFFAQYTKRFHEIIMAMPVQVFAGTAESSNPETLKYMRLYYNLCSEEYHLYQKGLIPKNVWNIWVEGMQIACNNETSRNAWNHLKGEYNREFWRYFQNNVIDKKTTDYANQDEK